MKKTAKIAICALLTATLLSPVCLSACKANEILVDEYELSAYNGENKDTSGNTIYNTSLFYNNQLKQGYPDPQVLDDTARSGYYYLYGTSNFQTMRSTDLAEWEYVNVVMPLTDPLIQRVISIDRWAPEVIYEDTTDDGKDNGIYYMFFSATPDRVWEDGKIKETGGDVNGEITKYCMYVATSKSPEGPFEMIDFTDEESCGSGNVHTYNTDNNIKLTEDEAKSGDYAVVEYNEEYYQAAFRHYWAKYCLFSPDELSKVLYENKTGTGGENNVSLSPRYHMTIDPHPFVDPVTKKKYLYFKSEGDGWNINIGVEMENWLKPRWDTAKYITASNYYTIADWEKGENGKVSYEFGAVCNEGAYMLYHEANGKGLYYFAFSVNDYGSSDYRVAIAVADSALGDFRKLTEEEGGLLLCSSTTDSKTVSGAGHNSFVTVGDQLYIVYHRHKDYAEGGSNRYTAIDEMRWITVKDKDGNDMVVPYVNGTTDSLQPKPEKLSGYKNVAPQATLTCSESGVETKYATDGLLSVHKSANATFMNYVRETEITETSTFEFAFENATSVRAIMVYNSSKRTEVFLNIPKIEFTLPDGSVRVIRDVKFDTEQYCKMGGIDGTTIRSVVSGAAAFAEFYDIDVKNIKITVEVPKGQEKVGISEIKILGKA